MISEGVSEVTTIEILYALAKQQPRTECLTLEMVREMVTSWVDDCGEWERVGDGYRRLE